MMDLDQIILIVGCVFLVLLFFVLPVFFHNRQTRIARYFKRNRDIRFKLVKKASKNLSALPEDLSHLEMVALLTIISFRDTVSDGLVSAHGLVSAQRFTTMGWTGRFNDEFFDRLNSTASVFAVKRWNRDSIDLFRLGQLIAQANNNSHWTREFAERIERLQHHQVQSGLPTRMK